MKNIVKQAHELLIKTQKTVAVAESCTGGLLCNLLTQYSGSSQYFVLGIVVYSNSAKMRILKIPAGLIVRKGAVSKEAAQRLAKGIRRLAKTNFGISITGIAGPTGGTKKKPAGTVFIAIDSENKKIIKKFHFTGNRTAARKKAALKALQLLLTFLSTA